MENAEGGRQEAEEESVIQPPPVIEPTVPQPPVIQQNIPVDTKALVQMMTAMTQLIQDSRQSGGSTSMDKYLKQFQDMKPPLFTGKEGPIEAENWLLRVEKILKGMDCPDERKVALATFVLDGEAERWWRGQQQDRFEGLPNDQIPWEVFIETFRDWFIPLSSRRQMQDKFMRLIQGDRSLMQYESEFTMLSRYAPQLVHTSEEKCYRFLSGLRDAIRQPLVPLGITEYSVLVERARMIEIDIQTTQRRHDYHKRKNTETTKQPQGSQSQGSQPKSSAGSGNSNWKKARPVDSGSQTGGDACRKCGRYHRGECLQGSNTCYYCHKPGHMAINCPKQGQNLSREARTNNSSQQRNYGKQKLNESSASAPSQNPTRQNVQPRVYALSQQDAKDSPDVLRDMSYI